MERIQSDLFGSPQVAGLSYSEGLVTVSEEQELIDGLSQLSLSPFRFHKWEGKRVTLSFGRRYDFDDMSLSTTEPIPEFLWPVREKAAGLAGRDAHELVHVLVTRYDPGAGIGWHRDKSVFGEVLGISLGGAAVLRFRKRTDNGFRRLNLPLAARSVYHLSGEARYKWEHSIAPGLVTRWSLTFRTLALTDTLAPLSPVI